MEQGISNYCFGNNICAIYKDSTDSTNTDVKKLAENGASEGTLVISEHQTAGRGRLGKTFYSPKGCGLYFSLLLKPQIAPSNAYLLTVAAAVSMKRAIFHIFDKETQIKWVNDIYFNGKKFCGILTESAIEKSASLKYAVLGIGINIYPPENGYPEEFAYKTTNLKEFTDSFPDDFKNKLLSKFLEEFFSIYENLENKEYVKEYRDSSCVTGKEIEILSGEHKGYASAIEIDDDANLLVKLKNGEIVSLSSGDISIRL